LEIAIGALEPQFVARAMQLAERPDLAERQYDVTGQDALRGELVQLFASRPRADWLALMEEDQTCVTPVRGVAEALADPDLRARGVVEDAHLADGSLVAVGRSVAWLPSGGRPAAAPALGEHTDEVLHALGRDPGSVRATGAVGPRP
ncbi:MAG TPA: CoA transferase, partial [Candidatus Nanopelagicales bacterium]|nr:CoA transferase [Candidatus Nanopelagicales bacterium]